MEEGVGNTATDGRVEGTVEGGHGAAPVLASGTHGGEADGSQGPVDNGWVGVLPGSMEEGKGFMPKGHGLAPVLALHGQGGSMDGGQGSPKYDDRATSSDATISLWFEGWVPLFSRFLKMQQITYRWIFPGKSAMEKTQRLGSYKTSMFKDLG